MEKFLDSLFFYIVGFLLGKNEDKIVYYIKGKFGKK